MSVPLDRFRDLVEQRRTSMVVDLDRVVPLALVEELCAMAMWAPNHKRTWPWRFAVFTGGGRDRLGAAYVADMVAVGFGDEGKRTKTLTKYRRTPAVLLVGAASHEKPSLHDENRDAAAAGIQTLLLGATAAGLASFWSTAPLLVSPSVNLLARFEADTRVVGVVYLGWPAGTAEPPARPPLSVTAVTE